MSTTFEPVGAAELLALALPLLLLLLLLLLPQAAIPMMPPASRHPVIAVRPCLTANLLPRNRMLLLLVDAGLSDVPQFCVPQRNAGHGPQQGWPTRSTLGLNGT